MVQQVVSRTQRRIERKQLLLAIVLIVAVAGCSFYLGMLFGRQTSRNLDLANDTHNQNLPVVTKVKPPPKPEGEVVEKPEKLTFYDNLPKGKQAPLGSGINLPPEKSISLEKAQPETEKKGREASAPARPAPKAESAPPIAADGAFVVQIASFRTDADAKKLVDRLKNYNLKTFVEVADLGDKGTWHRVLSGPFATRDNADAAARLLREKERLSALVKQR